MQAMSAHVDPCTRWGESLALPPRADLLIQDTERQQRRQSTEKAHLFIVDLEPTSRQPRRHRDMPTARLPVADCRLPIAVSRLPTAGSPVAGCRLPTAGYDPPMRRTAPERFGELLFYLVLLLVGYLAYLVTSPFLASLAWAGILAVARFERSAHRSTRGWAAAAPRWSRPC